MDMNNAIRHVDELCFVCRLYDGEREVESQVDVIEECCMLAYINYDNNNNNGT